MKVSDLRTWAEIREEWLSGMSPRKRRKTEAAINREVNRLRREQRPGRRNRPTLARVRRMHEMYRRRKR